MQKKHRIFIAINLPEDVKRGLGKYQEKYQNKFTGLFSSSEKEILDLDEANVQTRPSAKTSGGGIKWTTPNNLHITLEFLGDLTDEELGGVCMVVKEVAQKHKSFFINLEKISYGPPKQNPPSLVWVEGEKADELIELKRNLQEYLMEEISFRPEGKSFIPHITLARISEWEFRKIDPEERPEINEEISFAVPVESIEVMESELKRGGPQYTILESHILGE